MILNGTPNNTWLNSSSFSRLPSPTFLSQQEQEAIRVTFITVFTVISVLSLLGNTSLLAIVLLNRSMRTATNYFIVNMAVSDLFYVLFVGIPVIQKNLSKSLEMLILGAVGNALCKLTPFVMDASFAVSILSMVAIALDRFFAVVYPLRQKPFWVKSKFVIPLIWLVVIATYAIHFDVYRLAGRTCIGKWPLTTLKSFYLFNLTCFFIVPLTLITVIYSVIIHHIKNQNIPGNQTSEIEELRRKRNRSITKLGVLIVVWFFVCWAPNHTMILLKNFVLSEQPISVTKSLYFAGQAMALLSTTTVASNPILCFACSTNFRKFFVVTFLRCRPSNQIQTGQPTSITAKRFERRHTESTTVAVHGIEVQMMDHGRPEMVSEIGLSNALSEEKTIENFRNEDTKL